MKLVEKTVTYYIEFGGRLLFAGNAPAGVNVETGEWCFSPETIERLQQAVWIRCHHDGTVRLRIYEGASLGLTLPVYWANDILKLGLSLIRTESSSLPGL